MHRPFSRMIKQHEQAINLCSAMRKNVEVTSVGVAILAAVGSGLVDRETMKVCSTGNGNFKNVYIGTRVSFIGILSTSS